MKMIKTFLILVGLGLVLLIGYYFARSAFRPARYLNFLEWAHNPQEHPDWMISAKNRCQDSVFQFPTSGYVGFIWGDSFRPGHTHQGIDIFGGTDAGLTPVYVAYDGYLTRLPDWKSSLIIRVPSDPLQPDRQIWTYYTHMADPDGNSFISDDFPPGTSEMFIQAGTFLGYMGNYSGNPRDPVGVHLHFSIVKDDGHGKFLNELNVKNTLDPSRYFNLPLNAKTNIETIPLCPLTN
jgi:murein DD-endopeptidase MepM/ murein hydrolase activator NlpD